ncbi:hypothetical protein [Methylomonas sp. UP202]|uniref:hypothetical protein n=1 Tax=Methylomonas sp. UP202 TaxID=3040943 RepID=UPI00247A8A2A|nr:hypothetical protein [Methylomonas sp. UP202]WGS87221.1 hypothetical protein QC632_05590 [Methylomonas sp. UP202]
MINEIVSGSTGVLANAYAAAKRRYGGRRLAYFVAALVMLGFGDTLLPLIGHGVHVAIEIVEWLLEHWLEAAFGLSPRQAEIAVFWLGIVAIGYGSWRVARAAYLAALAWWRDLAARWRANSAGRAYWPALARSALVFGALGSTLLMFT